jgi:RNA polymerase sigma-70 factor, ECF subfamily
MRAMADRSVDNGDCGQEQVCGPPYDFDRIVRENSSRIYGMLYKMTGNASDAEDLVQEVFYNAYKSLPNFKGDSAVSTWLYRIATNVATDALRQKMRRPKIEQSMDFEEREAVGGIARTGGSAESQSMMNENLSRVKKAILKLPVQYRAPFVLNVVEGYSHEEIAKIMNISYGVARTRLYRAFKMIRAELAVENGEG